MHVFGLQLDIAWEDKPANFEQVNKLLADQRVPPGSLIVLPEMFSTGYSMNVAEIAEDAGRPAEAFLAQLATRQQSFVIGGVVNRSGQGKGFNEALVLSPEGAELARYAKMQPMTVAGEMDHYHPGERTVNFRWGAWTVSPLICYDLRFPELFREQVRRGAQLFAVIANFPGVREDHWLTLLEARAIENQAYVIGINRCGEDPNHHYTGRSVIFDPRGRLLADAGNEPGVIHADLALPELERYREMFPALKDMRPAEM